MSSCGPLPSKECSEWPHHPVYFCSHPEVQTKDYKPGEPLPLGAPVEFETDLFKGRIFVRLRPIESHPDDLKHHAMYFEGKKRFWQLIVQGQFKEELRMSDIKFGDFYEKPLRNLPRGILMKIMQRFIEAISPGVIMDVASDKPKVLNAFGSAQIMRIDLPGNEPEITGVIGNVQEDTSLILGPEFASPKSTQKRRKYLSHPKNAIKYRVSPEHVYTMELYDHTTNFGTYHQHALGNIKLDMVHSMNGQSLAFCQFTQDERLIWKFPLWHERLMDDIKKMEEEQSSSVNSIKSS